MRHIFKRLDFSSKKWRKIEKCLTILHHLIFHGSRNIIKDLVKYRAKV